MFNVIKLVFALLVGSVSQTAAAELGRYSLGTKNKQQSRTVTGRYVSPSADKESNWLPAPKVGGFSMNLRLYWPKMEALAGTWQPSAVKRSE